MTNNNLSITLIIEGGSKGVGSKGVGSKGVGSKGVGSKGVGSKGAFFYLLFITLFDFFFSLLSAFSSFIKKVFVLLLIMSGGVFCIYENLRGRALCQEKL